MCRKFNNQVTQRAKTQCVKKCKLHKSLHLSIDVYKHSVGVEKWFRDSRIVGRSRSCVNLETTTNFLIIFLNVCHVFSDSYFRNSHACFMVVAQ